MELFVCSVLISRSLAAWKLLKAHVSSNLEIYTGQSDDSKVVGQRVNDVLTEVPYHPALFAILDHHGQLQTFIQFVLRNSSRVLLQMATFSSLYVKFNREIFELPDGGLIGVDWASLGSDSFDSIPFNAPVVILHHGLVGDSQSEYLYHLTRRLLKEGYRVGAMVARGCGGLPLRTAVNFTGRKTSDMRTVLLRVKERYPEAKRFLMGFSLGAAAALNYVEDFHAPLLSDIDEASNHNSISDSSEDSLLDAAMVVSPPWNFHTRTADYLQIWLVLLALPLKVYVLQHREMYNALRKGGVTLWQLLTVWDIGAFDRLCYKVFGGINRHGDSHESPEDHILQYRSVEEYYDDAGPVFRAHLITTPTLAISAKDDPICCHTAAPRIARHIGPGLVVVKSELGGHLAFPEEILPLTHAWTDRVAVAWFNRFR